MGVYQKGQNDQTRFIQQVVQPSSQPIDVKQLAEELSKYMKEKEVKEKEEKIRREIAFDESKTMESIANSMLVTREDKESNMGDMSKNTIETKSDNKETNNTIDLLSQLPDN